MASVLRVPMLILTPQAVHQRARRLAVVWMREALGARKTLSSAYLNSLMIVEGRVEDGGSGSLTPRTTLPERFVASMYLSLRLCILPGDCSDLSRIQWIK